MTVQPELTAQPAPEDDEALVALIAGHDHRAFEAMMRKHNGKLFRVARAILRDDAEAEDALQDAYLDAYRHIADFRGGSRLATWLTRIVVNHALMKAALFLAAGAIFYRVGTVQLKELVGIGRKMPLTMAAFTIAGLGLVGTPGTSGFVSKWYLALGALDKGWWALVFLIVGSSLIALVYVGRVLELAWLRDPSPAIAHANDPPLSMLLPLIVLATATIYFGIDTEWTAGIAGTAAKAMLEGLR